MKSLNILANMANSGLFNAESQAALKEAMDALEIVAKLKTIAITDNSTGVVSSSTSLQPVAKHYEQPSYATAQVPSSDSYDELESLMQSAPSEPAVTTSSTQSKPSVGGAGAKWTSEEDAQLLAEFKKGMRASEMARAHNRSVPSILIRLATKKIISEQKKEELMAKFKASQLAKQSATPSSANLSSDQVEDEMSNFYSTPF